MRHLRDFGLTVVVLGLLGVAAGLAWSALAPRTPYIVTQGGPELADPTTQSLIAADGWFAVITGVAGLACGVGAYLLSRKGRPLALLSGLAVGGLLAGFLALSVGSSLGGPMVQAAAPGAAAVGSTVDVLAITAHGVLLCWALVAVAIFGLLESIDGYRDSPLRQPYAGEPPHTGS
ncbi:CPP1-like family protein [Sphaerisporangium fuscum]|uniref:CPP1-like family protein n=1 Tax=Sphaerisporangium fuscum TaxID=2835868 RepID=UPI001BDC4A4B|nr:CPP1-like family protein [Sphaerisporangium fuscum]